MLGSLAYVVLLSTKLISKITVTYISTILCLIFVDFDNPSQRKRCEFSKSYARARNLIFAIFCRTIATIRNFAKLQLLSNVNPLVFPISLWLGHTQARQFIVSCEGVALIKIYMPRLRFQIIVFSASFQCSL